MLEESTKPDQQKLVLGQVVFDIDRSIPELILTPVVGAHHHITSIKDMQFALQGKMDFEDTFEDENQRRCCQQKWEKLKTEIGWCGSLLHYMKLSIAHPSLNEDSIYAAMKHIQPSKKETFKKFLAIHKKVCGH